MAGWSNSNSTPARFLIRLGNVYSLLMTIVDLLWLKTERLPDFRVALRAVGDVREGLENQAIDDRCQGRCFDHQCRTELETA